MEFKNIIDTFEDAGYSPTRYSGRGMGGEYCVGIQVDGNPFDAIIDVAQRIANYIATDHGGDMFDPDSLDVLKGAKTDQLGKNHILYFPGLKWEDENEEDEDL